eukprot:282497_1
MALSMLVISLFALICLSVLVILLLPNCYIGLLALYATYIQGVLRPYMVKYLPNDLVVFIYSFSRNTYLSCLGKYRVQDCHHLKESNREINVMGLSFRNDLGNAAGLDKDGTLLNLSYTMGAGFAVVGTVLNRKHSGNLPMMKLFNFIPLGRYNPWTPLPETKCGLNSLGLPTKGIDEVIKNILFFKTECVTKGYDISKFPIGVSIMGHPLDNSDPCEKLKGVIECVEKCCLSQTADFIEINESCPNVDHGNHCDSQQNIRKKLKERLHEIIKCRNDICKQKCIKNIPILVKLGSLGHNKNEIIERVKFISDCGVDGIVAVNTQKDYKNYLLNLPKHDKKLFLYYTKKYNGGFSGPLIFKKSLNQIEIATQYLKKYNKNFTIIHVGGISNNNDVVKSRQSGAHLREWYTGLMHNIATLPINKVYDESTKININKRED